MRRQGVRDSVLLQLQLHGRQSAKQIAAALGRNEKLVMRTLADLVDEGVLVCDRVPEMRMLKLKGWAVRSFDVRYYRLPVRTTAPDPLRERWVRL